ncbi:MAG: hypothetical protein HOI23_17700 [Deltaproteobacteria bacterium]|nr:hypothetical protein [Deltaproteobacteria bacterium]MBT6435594.1 hypothetical protein [Deltaproteobacteria bacterium]MBT6489901.1 hypothetical protein [Deltaproteobacteria bacterium]
MNEVLQLTLATAILIGSTVVIVRNLIKRRQAACTGTCATCPSGSSNATGPGSCERVSDANPDLTQIRARKKE